MIQIDDYQLHAVYHFIDEKCPTLFLIHELAEDAKIWDNLIPFWGKAFNIVTYDFFGHGLTTDSVQPLTFDRLVNEVVTVIRHFDLKKIHLVGDDIGGILAIMAAKACRKNIESLTLLSSPFFMPKGAYTPLYQKIIRLMHTDRDRLPEELMFPSLYPLTMDKAEYIKHAFRRVRTQTFLNFIELLKSMNEQNDFFLLDDLITLRLPTLILTGEYESYLPMKLQITFATLIPMSKFFVIPDVALHLILDRPKVTASLIKSFVSNLDSPAHTLLNEEYRKELQLYRSFIQKNLKEFVNPENRSLTILAMHGLFTVTWNGQLIQGKWNQRHAAELLLFIAVNGGKVSREHIISVLSLDRPLSEARKILRGQIAHLNKIFRNYDGSSDRHFLITTRSEIRINVAYTCDLFDFIEKVKTLDHYGRTIEDRAKRFIALADAYSPESLSYLNSEWLSDLLNQVENIMAHALTGILEGLIEQRKKHLVLKLLETGKRFEPYEGYCEEERKLIK